MSVQVLHEISCWIQQGEGTLLCHRCRGLIPVSSGRILTYGMGTFTVKLKNLSFLVVFYLV